MKSWSLVATAGLAAVEQVQAGVQDKCFALALNGGGAKGAYQAGAIYSFMHDGNPDDFQWDVVTGISGGAMNAGGMSVWAKEDGLKMSEWLQNMWNENLHTHDVWKWWPGGIIAGLTTEQSILNSAPLLEYLTALLTDTSTFPGGVLRHTIVGTVNIDNGFYKRFRLDEIPKDQFATLGPKQIVSSASLPGLFLPQLIDGAAYTDGGTAMGLDGVSAVEKCLELVDDESQITMDILLLDRFEAPRDEGEDGDTVSNMLRQHEIKSYYMGLQNVIVTMMSHPHVNYRYILEPSGKYPKLWNLLNFSPNNTWPLQEMGMADAKAALKAGEGAHFKKFHDWIATREQHGQSLKDFVDSLLIQ